jgi:hypothetical protein
MGLDGLTLANELNRAFGILQHALKPATFSAWRSTVGIQVDLLSGVVEPIRLIPGTAFICVRIAFEVDPRIQTVISLPKIYNVVALQISLRGWKRLNVAGRQK